MIGEVFDRALPTPLGISGLYADHVAAVMKPLLDYTRTDGSAAQCRFDGVDEASGTLIDRKRAVVTTQKVQNQALRQSEALRENGYRGRWEVPSAREAQRAINMFENLGIDNIDVTVVPELGG